MEAPKHETLCVGNIDHSVKREELEHSLYELFVQYGPIVSIKIVRKENVTPHRGRNKQGQLYAKPMPLMKTIAFVSYISEASATNAKRTLNDFEFFGRKLMVDFARQRADVVAYEKGEVVKKEAVKTAQPEKKIVLKKAAPAKKKEDVEATTQLVVDNLTAALTEEVMRPLFEQFPGMEEMKHLVGQNKLKIDFRREEQAARCREELQGFNVDGRVFLSIGFGRE